MLVKLNWTISLALCLAGFASAAPFVVTGAGATFPEPIYRKWFAQYSKLHPDVQFVYKGVGSGQGQSMIVNGEVDFAASDAPMSDEALANAPAQIEHIPMVGGADVLIFNVHGVSDLRLDGPTLAGIFLGKITHWNDPAIVKQNPGLRMPEEDITVVHRSDASGTTFVFTDYLSTISPEWRLKVGRYLAVNWPVGLDAPGNEAVSKLVRRTPGAIGYTELLYSIQNGLPQARIKNASGAYVAASSASVTAALATAKIADDLRISIVNAPGAAAYPIAGVTWLLMYRHPKDPEMGQRLAGFLRWALGAGQEEAPQMDYAALPVSVRSRVLKELQAISPP